MADWKIEKLNSAHDREAFACGNASLDSFLKTLVSQYERRRIGRTYVATRGGETRVLGYYTASSGLFALQSLPEEARKRLPKYPMPTIHLGRLGVDLSCQGQGLGRTLLFHFLHKALGIAQELGVHAVDVRATDDRARDFYRKYEFIPLLDEALHLYLPMRTVEQMFASDGGDLE